MSELLKQIPHLEELQDLQEEFQDAQMDKSYTTIQERKNSCNKIVPSLEEAIRRSGLRDGMTVSFHHHFRNGDYIVNMVMDKLDGVPRSGPGGVLSFGLPRTPDPAYSKRRDSSH